MKNKVDTLEKISVSLFLKVLKNFMWGEKTVKVQ